MSSTKTGKNRQPASRSVAKVSKKPKLFFKMVGPIGGKWVQARTPDEARGVYKAWFNSKITSFEIDLDCITIQVRSEYPPNEPCLIPDKRKGVKAKYAAKRNN